MDENTPIKYNLDGRYADAGFAFLAVERAEASGTLRRFRVKYRAQCACCGKVLQTGMPVVSPERGKIVGRCCILSIN